MFDPAGLPAYGTPPPPAPPPPTRTPTWVRFLIGGFVLLVVLFAIGVVEGFSSTEPESTFDEDGFYFVEQETVMAAVRPACQDLQDSAAALGPIGTQAQAVARLGAVSTDMRAIASAIQTADPDPGAQAWRDDWMQLAYAIDEFARDVGTDPTARFSMPSSQGFRLSERMYTGTYECFVPVGVVALDPSPESDQYYSE